MKRAESEKYTLKEFDLSRYTGKWYEISRIENSFEKGMTDVTAQYTIEGKTIRVVNRGFITSKQKWKEAKAVAKLKYSDIPNILRVSFFRPFYADYIILAYDAENYNWAVVRSTSHKYLWILCRKPVMNDALYNRLIDIAVKDGFNRSSIMKISQEKNIDSTN